MDSSFISFLIFSAVVHTIAVNFSIKGDPCSKFDSCDAKQYQRTCSCSEECHLYGTCCQDAEKAGVWDTQFMCYNEKAITSVFVQKACSDSYKGHLLNINACLDDNIDDMDVHNNLLVTSHRTKTTYFNKECAICNNEDEDDLVLWNIEVFCPLRNDVDRRLIRKNLTYDEDTRQWGLRIGGEFFQCIVKYAPPPYISELDHCLSHLISSCPEDYSNKEIITNCFQYYGERSLKHSNKYYRNIHCAICNGVDVRDLECSSGMKKRDDDEEEETDFRKMKEEVFTRGRWIEKDKGQRYQCSKGFRFDPFRQRCRKFEMEPAQIFAENSTVKLRLNLLSILIFVLFLI